MLNVQRVLLQEAESTLEESVTKLEQRATQLDNREQDLVDQEAFLLQREQELSENQQLEAEEQSTIAQLTEEREQLMLDRDQLQIDRDEISRQREDLNEQRMQMEKDQGQLSDRERIVELREQQLDERESLMAAVGLPPHEMAPPAAEEQVNEEETTASAETAESSEEAAAPQATGSLLESFLSQPDEASQPALEPDPEPEQKSGMMLQTSRLLNMFKSDTPAEPAPEAVEPEPPAPESAAPAEPEPAQATQEEEEENSIASYMEQLLERSRTKSPGSSSPAAPVSQTYGQQPAKSDQPVCAQLSMEEKLATLSQAPTHTQDRDAVRDAMNSFREVSNYSARMAIARHSMKHQRTDLLFKGILTGVCVLTTLIIFGESIWGSNTLGVIKWAALAVSITSTAQFLRGLHDVKKLLPGKTELSSMDVPSEPAEELQEFEDEPADTADGNSLSAATDTLSEDEKALQSLEAQLLENARRKSSSAGQQGQSDFDVDAEP
jgi:cell division initiation protein